MTRKHKTFGVSNEVIQAGPFIFGPTYKKSRLQMYLPGMEPPFGTFDYWATIGLYSLLDPGNPTAPVTVKPTQLLGVLDFARVITEATDEDGPREFKTYPSQDYRLIEDTLNRLFTVEVRLEGHGVIHIPGQKGRPRKQVWQYRGRILQEYGKVWPAGVTPPDALPPSERGRRRNVNQAKDPMTGEAGGPVWEFKKGHGPKPAAITYRLASRLVNGLTGEDPHIGATFLPTTIFELRRDFQKLGAAATNLLFWVCRQRSLKMTRALAGLSAELNLNPDYPDRNHKAILKAFDLLLKAGIISEFKFNPKDQTVAFTKNPDWLKVAGVVDEDAPPALAAPDEET